MPSLAEVGSAHHLTLIYQTQNPRQCLNNEQKQGHL